MTKLAMSMFATKADYQEALKVDEVENPKWVRILADYSANGIWAKCGSSMELEELPVSDELRSKLQTWNLFYDQYVDTVDFDLDIFSADGLKLAQLVKKELPDWTVIYFDELLSEISITREVRFNVTSPRASYEYEVV